MLQGVMVEEEISEASRHPASRSSPHPALTQRALGSGMKVDYSLFLCPALGWVCEYDSSPQEVRLERLSKESNFKGVNPDQLTNDEVSEFVKNVSLSPKCKVTLRVNPEVPFAYTQQVMEQVASAGIAKLTFEPFGKQAVSLADPKGSYVVPLELPPQILINDD